MSSERLDTLKAEYEIIKNTKCLCFDLKCKCIEWYESEIEYEERRLEYEQNNK